MKAFWTFGDKSQSEALVDARDAYSQTFLSNMTEEQTVGYEGFAKWGDFEATCEDYGETLFEKVMYFDNAMPHQRLCDALKTQVESAIDEGELPFQMKTYQEQALYDVTADASIESVRWPDGLCQPTQRIR